MTDINKQFHLDCHATKYRRAVKTSIWYRQICHANPLPATGVSAGWAAMLVLTCLAWSASSCSAAKDKLNQHCVLHQYRVALTHDRHGRQDSTHAARMTAIAIKKAATAATRVQLKTCSKRPTFEPLQGGWRNEQSLLTGDALYSCNICTTPASTWVNMTTHSTAQGKLDRSKSWHIWHLWAADSQCTLVQVAGAAQAVSMETGPCSAIHCYWKVAADTKMSFAACCPVMQLPNLGMWVLHK